MRRGIKTVKIDPTELLYNARGVLSRYVVVFVVNQGQGMRDVIGGAVMGKEIVTFYSQD